MAELVKDGVNQRVLGAGACPRILYQRFEQGHGSFQFQFHDGAQIRQALEVNAVRDLGVLGQGFDQLWRPLGAVLVAASDAQYPVQLFGWYFACFSGRKA
ncbi:hypothetical protein D3C75_813550 [compost metagenome]